MWGPIACLAVLLGIGVGVGGCSVVSRRASSDANGRLSVQSAATSSESNGGVVAAADRISDLEQLLAARDREIAAARAELTALRQQERDRRGAAGLGPATDIPVPIPPSGSAGSASPSTSDGQVSPAEIASARAEAARATRQLASVEAQLSRERRRRKVLEQDLQSLREETSAGPFERQNQFALREALARIAELDRALATEKDEREELARRYEALQAQTRLGDASRQDEGAPRDEQLARLEAEQAEALADLRRELGESRQREDELRATIAAEDGTGAAMLASTVSTLKAENSSLEARIEEERQRNAELASKLKSAMRVTELIFKMRGEAVAESAP